MDFFIAQVFDREPLAVLYVLKDYPQSPPIAFMFQVVLLITPNGYTLLKYQRVATSITWSYIQSIV